MSNQNLLIPPTGNNDISYLEAVAVPITELGGTFPAHTRSRKRSPSTALADSTNRSGTICKRNAVLKIDRARSFLLLLPQFCPDYCAKLII